MAYPSQSPFADESDPNAPQFATFPEGNHDVIGIFDYQTTDEKTGLPYFKESNGRPVTRLWLKLANGEKGPIMSADASQLALLVVAFAGPEYLPMLEGINRITSEFPLRVKQIVNFQAEGQEGKSAKKQIAYVNKAGWVANVSGMKPPLNTLYQFKYLGFRNMDGSTDIPAFQEGNFDSGIMLQFQIIADMWGKPCPYSGYIESVRVNRAFEGMREIPAADGTMRVAPRLRLTDTGARHVAASRIVAFVDAYCPELGEYQWVTDPTKSQFGVNEVENPLPVILALALKGNRKAVGEYDVTTKKNQFLDLASLKSVPDELQPTGLPATQTQSATLSTPANMTTTNIQKLVRFIDIQCVIKSEASAFTDMANTLALSDAGKNWCATHLSSLWVSLGLPEDRKLASLTEEQAGKLLIELEKIETASSGF